MGADTLEQSMRRVSAREHALPFLVYFHRVPSVGF